MILLQLLGALTTIAALLVLANMVVDAVARPAHFERDAEGLIP